MFSATRHILETITRDPVTGRVRSIKPDEQVESMWDGLDKTARAYSVSDGVEVGEGFEASYAYTEADEIEDALLFPLEATGQMSDNLFRNELSAMEVFEKETIDINRLADDLDTDESSIGSDGEYNSDQYDSESEEKALAALEDDDGDSDWATDEEKYDDGAGFVTEEQQNAIDQTVDMLSDQMKKFGSAPDYLLPVVRDPASAKNIPDIVKNDPEIFMRVLRHALRCTQEYDTSDMGIEADFFRHLDRQKSKGMYFYSSRLAEALS
jgi:hypothetical protein